MVSRQKLLDRLAKFLALAASSNAHEAASAREKADDLMRKHGISEDEVARNQEGLYERSLGAEGWNATWRFSLVTAASRYHGCEAVALEKRRKRYVRIVGTTKVAVDKAEALYRDLLSAMLHLESIAAREIEAADDNDLLFGCTHRQCVDSFRRGATAGLILKLARARPHRFGLGNPSKSPSYPASASPPASPPRSTSAALVRSFEAAQSETSERVSSKYRATKKPLDLDEAASDVWYFYGTRLAGKEFKFVDVEAEAAAEAGEASAPAGSDSTVEQDSAKNDD